MARLARQAARSPLTQGLAAQLGDAPAIESFLRQYWRFVADPIDAEYIRAPENQLAEFYGKGFLQGDCDDSATLGGALLAALGIPAVLVAIRPPWLPEFSHVFVRAFSPLPIDIDPIVPADRLPITNVAEFIQVPI